MPMGPFESGGGAVQLDEKSVREFFGTAQKASDDILGCDDGALIGEKVYLSPTGIYANLRRTTIIENGKILGSYVVASLFRPELISLSQDGGADEDDFEGENEAESFTGKYIELGFNTVDREFHRVENFLARLVLKITGEIEIEEGVSVFNIDTDHEDYDSADELTQIIRHDAKTPKVDDFIDLNEIVILLKR